MGLMLNKLCILLRSPEDERELHAALLRRPFLPESEYIVAWCPHFDHSLPAYAGVAPTACLLMPESHQHLAPKGKGCIASFPSILLGISFSRHRLLSP